VLQEREFERVGGNKTIKVDVRVVATTNRDLMSSVHKGYFRQDLYYRLNVFPIHVPPLREREGDVVLLAKTFAQKFARKHGIKLGGFENEALKALSAHGWPGNVRELQNTIERAVILTESGAKIASMSLGLMPTMSTMGAFSGDQPVAMREPVAVEFGGGASFGAPEIPSFSAPAPPIVNMPESDPECVGESESPLPLEQIEKQHILGTLETTDGNRTQAAKLLGISIRTLRNKLALYRKDGEFIAGEG
jgi:transcriptional regulator with GAF, ATPase, and Fis domain